MNNGFYMKDIVPLIKESISGGRDFKMSVKGGSMYPFLFEGRDSVFFSEIDREIKKGDIVLFQRNDVTFVMHRVYKINSDGSFDFLGDAQGDTEKNISKNQLIAIVKKAERDGKIINCEKGFWRRIMTVYMDLKISCPSFAAFLLKFFSFISGVFKKLSGKTERK